LLLASFPATEFAATELMSTNAIFESCGNGAGGLSAGGGAGGCPAGGCIAGGCPVGAVGDGCVGAGFGGCAVGGCANPMVAVSANAAAVIIIIFSGLILLGPLLVRFQLPVSSCQVPVASAVLHWQLQLAISSERRPYGEAELEALLRQQVVVEHAAALRVHRKNQPERHVQHRHEEPDFRAC
jgi:hypothetical protein